MSRVAAVISFVCWLALFAGAYAWCLHRYERGRQVTFAGFDSPKVAPVRLTRIPDAWLAIIFLIAGTGIVLSAIAWPAALPAGLTDWRTTVALVAVFVVLLLAVGTVRAVHNRGCTEWPKPGWYDDATDEALMHWWNGIEWTAHTYPRDRYVPDPFAATSQAE